MNESKRNRNRRGRGNFSVDDLKQSQNAAGRGDPRRDRLLRAAIFQGASRRKLFYYEPTLSLSGTGGILKNYFYSCNGAYDPNITGTGHQPCGYDQMMSFYNQATVMKSSISVVFYNGGGGPVRVAIHLTPDTSTSTDVYKVMENGQLTTSVLSQIGIPVQIFEHHLSCDVRKYFGRSKNAREMLNDDKLYSTASANPTEQCYFAISTWDPYAATNTLVYFDVFIEMDMVFWEPRLMTES